MAIAFGLARCARDEREDGPIYDELLRWPLAPQALGEIAMERMRVFASRDDNHAMFELGRVTLLRLGARLRNAR